MREVDDLRNDLEVVKESAMKFLDYYQIERPERIYKGNDSTFRNATADEEKKDSEGEGESPTAKGDAWESEASPTKGNLDKSLGELDSPKDEEFKLEEM